MLRDTIFLRVALLVLAAVTLIQIVTFLSIRQHWLDPTSELIASVIAAKIQTEVGIQGPVPNSRITITQASPEPGAGAASIPFERDVSEALLARLPVGSAVQLAPGAINRKLWVRVGSEGDWLEVSGFSLRQRAMSVLAITVVVAGLIVLAGAAIAARILTHPMASLAARAPNLVMGQETRPPQGPWEVEQLGQSLLEAAQQRAEAESERELLLAGISHDLRSPLARLRLREEMSGNNSLNEDLDELEEIVDSFIGYVRDGRDEEAKLVDMDEWAESLAAPFVAAGELSLDANPCKARIRPLALKRATVNLIENALTHGRSPVTLSVVNRDNSCIVEVTDHGDGLPPERLEIALRPFESFDAARASRNRGLGLATVQRIAAAHHGKFSIANLSKGGLRATIEIPE